MLFQPLQWVSMSCIDIARRALVTDRIARKSTPATIPRLSLSAIILRLRFACQPVAQAGRAAIKPPTSLAMRYAFESATAWWLVSFPSGCGTALPTQESALCAKREIHTCLRRRENQPSFRRIQHHRSSPFHLRSWCWPQRLPSSPFSFSASSIIVFQFSVAPVFVVAGHA